MDLKRSSDDEASKSGSPPNTEPVSIEQASTGVCVAHLSGDVDIAVVPRIRDALEASITGGCSDVVLDLAEVSYADSSALGLLVWLDHRLQPGGGRLVLVNADPNISRMFEITGLLRIVPSVSTAVGVGEAVAGLDAVPPPTTEPLWSEEVVVPALAENLAAVRTQVCNLVSRLDLPDAALFDTKVAVGEALANAVRHGSPRGADDEVHAAVTAYDDRVVVTVRDYGVGFSGDHAPADDLYASSGRGILFMRALMDGVEFEHTGEGGTIVRLTKRLAASAEDSPRGTP